MKETSGIINAEENVMDALFSHMHRQHKLLLVDSQLQDILLCGDPFDRAIVAMSYLADALHERPDKQKELRGAIEMLCEWKEGYQNDMAAKSGADNPGSD